MESTVYFQYAGGSQRLSTKLEMRVFLKLNKRLLRDTHYPTAGGTLNPSYHTIPDCCYVHCKRLGISIS